MEQLYVLDYLIHVCTMIEFSPISVRFLLQIQILILLNLPQCLRHSNSIKLLLQGARGIPPIARSENSKDNNYKQLGNSNFLDQQMVESEDAGFFVFSHIWLIGYFGLGQVPLVRNTIKAGSFNYSDTIVPDTWSRFRKQLTTQSDLKQLMSIFMPFSCVFMQ